MTLSRTAKRLLLVAVLTLAPSLAFAQGGQFSTILSANEPLPNCTPATGSQRQPIIWDATAGQVKTCTGTNIWTQLGGGGGGGTPGSPVFSVQVNSSGTFGGIALGNSGAPLLSGGAGAFAAFGPINLAGGVNIISGLLPTVNMPGTTVNSVVNDTNVTGSISGQALTLGWTGTLAKPRTLATTVYTDQSNTYSAGPQTFPGGDFFAGGVNNQTGVSYTFVAADINKLVTFSNGGATAVTLPRATTAGFTSGATIHIFNLGVGAVTITPTTSTFNGNATVVLNQNQGAFIESDGTNYEGWVSSAPSGSGTVTSVALTVNSTSPSGIFTVTGSPVTTSGTLNFNLAGTTGGIPYFSSGTVLSSSAAPAANAVVLWGGAGSQPTGTVADATATHVLHATNPVAFGAIVNADVAAVTWAAFAAGTATSTATFPGGDLFMGGVNEQTGTTYTVVAADENKMLTLANASAVAVTLPQTITAGFGAGALFYVFNEGPSTATITPTVSTINDAATLTLTSGTGATIVSDGTNYSALVGGAASFVNPMTTLGDMIYENSTPAAARLAGPTSPNGIAQSLCSTPAGGLAAAPQWCIPGVAIDAQTGTTFNVPITDDVTFITGNNAGATAWTGFTLANNYTFAFENLGAGLITYTPASGTVNGNANQIIPQFWFGFHYTNNTNTFMPVVPTIQAWPNCPVNVLHFTSSTGVISCAALTLTGLATQANATMVANTSGGVAAPTAVAIPASAAVTGTNANGAFVAATGHGVVTPLDCADSSGSGTAQVCNTTPTYTPVAGDCIVYTTTTANTGTGLTVNVNSLGAKSVAKWQTTTTIAANDMQANVDVPMCYDGTNWDLTVIGNGPSGSGTVTSFSAGSLSPLFTTSVATATTTPALTFSLSNAAGGTVFGNNTSSSAAPVFTSVPVLGVDNTTSGTLQLANGSAAAHTILGSAATTTNTVNFFATAPTSKQIATCVVASTTCTMTAIDFPDVKVVPAANCQNTTGGASWSIGASGVVTCRAGTNDLGGFISITDTASSFATFQIAIPEDWDTSANPYIRFQLASTDTTTGHTIIPSIQVACYKGDGSTTDDVAPNAAHSLSTTTLNSTTNQFWSTSNVQMNSTDVTGCVAGALMQITVGRATDTATNAEFYSATITFPRLLTVQAN